MIALTRRQALRLLAIAPVALGPRPRQTKRLKVLVAGGHPDDPESGCGGTIARYVDAGHQVLVLYLTRGEAAIEGKSHDEAARIRTAEAERACAILRAEPRFAGQVDGDSRVDNAAYAAMHERMARFRGMEHQCEQAEAFVRHDRWPALPLPG